MADAYPLKLVDNGDGFGRIAQFASGDTVPLDSLAVALGLLGKLIPAADKLPFFSSASAAALADLTSFARTLLDDVDAPTARSTLGLGAAAVMAVLGTVVSGGASGALFQFIAGSDGQSFALRLPDGTQFAWGTSTDTLNTNGAYGSGYISSPAYTAYPAAFSSVPRVMYVTQNHTNAPSLIITDTTPSTTSCSTRIFGFVQNAQAKYGYFAIGRWN